MDVVRTFLGHAGFPAIVVAARRLVIMAQEQPCCRRQREDLADRPIELAGIAAGKIAARGAVIRHEQRVADKGGIADDVGHAGRCMARRVDGSCLDAAQPEGLAILEQMLELATIAGEAGLRVEQIAEGLLHLGDGRADRQPAAQLFQQVRRGRQVIGVDMGLQNPFDRQALRLYMRDQPVGGIGACAPRGRIEIQHRIDNGRLAGRRIGDDVADRVGRLVEEAVNVGAHGVLQFSVPGQDSGFRQGWHGSRACVSKAGPCRRNRSGRRRRGPRRRNR